MATSETIDDDITAFLAENKPDDDEPSAEEAPQDGEEPTEGEGESAATEGGPGGEEQPDDEPSEGEPEAFKVDGAKLAEAVEKKDLSALLEAMGPAAEEMLTSKAHVTLRIAEKEIKKLTKQVAAGEEKLKDTTIKLAEKYGDPIAARKAAEAGDVDAFVETMEKWSGGHSWNDLMKWVGEGLKGRTQRLEAKAADQKKTNTEAQARRDAAVAETKSWISTSLQKTHKNVLEAVPDVIDLVIAELRDGVTKGIDSPAKAMPLVMKKLQKQHEALGKLFAAKTKKTSTRAPSTKIGHEGTTKKETRELTLEESIAQYVKENRPR